MLTDLGGFRAFVFHTLLTIPKEPYFRAMKSRLLLIAFLIPFSLLGQSRCVGNCSNGVGTYTWPSGNKYVGEWKNGKKSGQGTFTWASGSKYVGEWNKNKRDGQGAYTWPNGSKYVGEWKQNERTGKGTLMNQYGNQIHPNEVEIFPGDSGQAIATMTSSKPPILSISDIEFIDGNGNNTIDAFEENTLTFSINNTGPGNGYGLKAEVSMSGNIQGINCNQVHTLATVEHGSSRNYTIPISSTRFTTDGSIQINVEVIEPNGFSPEPFALEIDTRAFRAPKLEVVDFSSSMTPWEPNTPIGLDLLIQNTGEGTAENVAVELKLPNAVNCYSNNLSVEVTYIAPGETLPITYDMIVPRNFDQNNVTANLTVTEKFGDYGSNWNHSFPFEGGNNGTNVISIEASDGNDGIEIDRASLNTKNNKTADVSFNQVPKDIVVKTVAVLPIDGIDCSGKTVSGQDIASFTEGSLLGIYNVVERRNLERVLDEQKLALSGILFEKSAVEAGCNVGAQGIIFTEYGCLTGQEVIQLKLVDCQTSELYWSATGINATAKQVLDKVREELEKE